MRASRSALSALGRLSGEQSPVHEDLAVIRNSVLLDPAAHPSGRARASRQQRMESQTSTSASYS